MDYNKWKVILKIRFVCRVNNKLILGVFDVIRNFDNEVYFHLKSMMEHS